MTTNYNGIIFDDEQPSGGNYSGIIFDDDPVASRIPKESVSTLKNLGILNEEGNTDPLSDDARREMNYNIHESERRAAAKWASDNNKDGVFGSMSPEERAVTPDLVARGLESIEYRAKGDIDSARARALQSLHERLVNEEDFDPMSVDGVMYEMEKDYRDMSPAAREFLIREAVLKDVGGDLEKYEKEFLPTLTPEERNEEAIRVRNIVAWGNQSQSEEPLNTEEMGPLEKVQNDFQAKYGVKASKGYSAAVATTPFADTAIAVADMFITEDLEKLMKGDFNLDEVLNSGKFDSFKEAYDSGEWSKTKTRNMIKLVAYELLREKAENQGEAVAERERRGVSTWGHVGAGGMEVFALGGEFLTPFAPAGKGATVGTKVATAAARSAVPVASSAARRYADLRTNDYSFDENGNLYVSAEADSVGDAIVKSAVGAVAEVTIEKIGGEFLGKVFGATVGKAASSKVGQAVANNGVVRGVGKVVNFAKTPLKALGWNGLPGEMGEEFLQGATDAFLGLDTTESRKEGTTAAGRFKEFAGDFFEGENLVELAESMLLMQAVGGGSAYLQQRYSSKQLDKIITTRIGGVSENVLKKLSPEEKARIIEAHYSGLSAEEAADIINKGAGALDKFMIEKQTEATKSAKGRAMLAEMNPEAADAIRAARREGKDISRKMIRDLGLSEKVLGDVESRNKFGDALLEDGRKLAAKNAAKMDGQHEMALRQEIGRLTQDTSEAQRVYDRVVMKIKDASVLDDPYQREQLVMQAAEAVYAEDQARRVGGARQRARMSERADYEARLAEAEARATEQAQRAVNDAQERINAEMMARETKRYNDFMLAREEARAKGGLNEARTDEAPAQPKQAQSVTPPAGEEARPVEAGKAPTKVGREIEASKSASKTPIGAPIETKVSLPPTTAESATGGSKAADAASASSKPKTVKDGKAFVNSNIGKRYTDGKKAYEITGLTKDGEVSVKVTDKIGKSSETTLKLSSALNNIFGTKKKSAVWSEVKATDSEQKSPNRTKTTADDVARLADETVPTYLKAMESSHSGGNIGEDYKIESNFANEVLKMVKGMSESELGEVSTSLRKTLYAKGNPMPGGYKPLLDAASYALDAAREGKGSVRLPMPEHLRTRVKTTAKTSKMEQKVPKAEVADEKTAIPPKEKEKPNEPEDKSEEEVSVKEPSNLLNIVNFDPKQESHVKDLIRTIPNVLKRSLKDYSEYDSKLREFVERFNEQLQKFGYLAEVPKLKVPANPDAYILLGDFGQTVEMVESPALFKIYGSEKSLLQKGKVHTSTDDQSLYSGNSVMAERSLLQELITSDAKTMTLDTWLKKWSPVKELIRVNEDRYNKDREKSLAPLYYSALLGSVEKASILKKYGISAVQPNGDSAEKGTTPPKDEPKAEAKKKEKTESKSEIAPSITPAEAMKKLGTLGAADVDTLTKAMHREERLGHTERANMIRVLRDYKRGVGTNSNPQSDETSGGKYRASVEAAKPLDDPAFVAWAKKRGVAPTTQKRNEYDKAMADTLTNRLSRWIKGVTVKWVNFIVPEEGGDGRAAKKRSRAGTVDQVVPENERAVFRQEFMRLKSDYEHSNDGNAPLSGGLFTSDAYYLYDIIGGNPVSIERIPLDEKNKSCIFAFDKKYKGEIYKGTRSPADWVNRFWAEYEGVLLGRDVINGEKSKSDGGLDVSNLKGDRTFASEGVGNKKILRNKENSGSSSETKNQTVYLHDGERIVGSYNRVTGEVKLAKGASVETVLHELGWHAARHWAEVNADSDPKAKALLEQMKKYAESAPKEIKDAVRDVYGDLDADTLLDEIGAARFTKEQSGKIAEALATKEGAAWYQKVCNKVIDFFKNFLTKIGYNRVDLDGVENMSPEVFGDFLADVMMSGKRLGERTAFSMEAPKGLAAKWTNNLSDYKAPIAELEKRVTGSFNNIYYLARTLEGQAQRGKNRAERAIKRVEKILGEDVSPELLAQYMQLKAYEERNAKIERRNGKADASGMTPEDAKAIEKTINESGVDEAIFEEAAQILWDLQKEGLQARVDAGLLDQETVNKWMTDEPHHIPWKDAVDPDSGEYVGRRMGASEFDTAEGRKTAASGDPITWMLQEYQDAMTRAAQNRLRSAIANLTRLNGDVGTIYDGIQTDSKGKRSFIKYPKDGGTAKVFSIPEGVKIESTVKNDGGMKNVLTFKEGGETKYLVLNGTLGEAVAGAATGRTLARPPAWVSWGMRAYAATATALSPTFALRNLTADNFDIHNYLVSKNGFIKGEKMFVKVLAEQGKMFWPLMRYVYTGDFKFGKNGEMSKFQKLVEAYEEAGGLIGGMATEGYDATVKKVQAKFRAGKNKVRAVGEGVIKSWLTLQRMSELGPRLAIFKAGIDSGMSAKDAAMMAREATVDFNKKGQKTPWFNTLWMFSNSALGSNLTQLKNINSRAGITLLGGWCLYGFAEGLVDAMLGGDDDELAEEGLATGEDISEYTRKNSLYIRNGSTVYRANIHMGPFAYAKYFGNCMARVAAGKLDGGKAAKELTKSGVEIGTTLTGLGNVNAEAFFQTAVPTLLQTPTQIATGVDYAGREMYRKKYTEEHPDSSYGRPSTPEVYHNVAKWLNRVTGGNEARKGWLDVRPETLQALTEMGGKNFARDVVEITETGYKVATGDIENLDIRNVPFAGDFVRTHESNANRFYEALNLYRADKYELKNNPELKGEARRKFLKERPWLYSAGKPGVTRIDNIVKRIEKLRDIEESDRATKERKAEAKAMRLKLQARVIEIMKGK